MAGKAKELWNYLRFRLDPYMRLDASAREPLAKLLRMLETRRAEGVEKRRFGAPHDGGYVMLDDFQGIAGAYSLGVGPEVSWDLALARRGVRVWQYDPTVTASPTAHALFHFEPWRIGALDDADRGSVSLPGLIRRNGHEGAELILKMDIEGAEWPVLAAIDPAELRVFRQILIEFHSLAALAEPPRFDEARQALENLTRHHQAVHVHANNLSRIVTAGRSARHGKHRGLAGPARCLSSLGHQHEMFPGPHDRSSSRIMRDFPLGRFRF